MGNSVPVRAATELEVATLSHINRLLEQSLRSSQAKTLLKRIWSAVMPYGAVFSLPSPFWINMGFRNEDPRIDLYGTGCLAIEQLLFFAEKFPLMFVRWANKVSMT